LQIPCQEISINWYTLGVTAGKVKLEKIRIFNKNHGIRPVDSPIFDQRRRENE